MKKISHFFAWSILWTAYSGFGAPPEIRETTIHELPDRRVIVERTPGIILSDPPEPIIRPDPEPETAERLAELAAEWRAQRISHPFIHAGATVYRLPDGITVTHVSNFSVNNSPSVSFWSSADLSILAHPAGFTQPTPHGDVNYSMLLFWTLHDVSTWKEFKEKRDLEYEPPEVPDLPEGLATWIPDDGENAQFPDDATIKAINHLHEYYNANLNELKVEYAELEAERAARRAELEANPPQPRDIYLRVSRLSPEQAAAWHAHAVAETTSRREKPTEEGERR